MEIKIPKGYRNIGITINNKLIADTNDSSDWDTICIPLPKGFFRNWKIINKHTEITETGIVLLK